MCVWDDVDNENCNKTTHLISLKSLEVYHPVPDHMNLFVFVVAQITLCCSSRTETSPIRKFCKLRFQLIAPIL